MKIGKADFHHAILCGALAVASILQTASTAAAPRATLIVTAQWLRQHADDDNLVLLHVGTKRNYAAGHIRNARFVDLETFGPHTARNGLMLELPSGELLHRNLAALGVSDGSQIIVYSDSRDVSVTTRVIFTLDAAGLGDRVSLLDGGIEAWRRGGNTLSTEVPVVKPGTLAPVSMQQRVVDAAFVQQHLNVPGYRIVDARAPVFYDGIQASMANLKGHLPGAVNIPFTAVSAMDLTLKSPEDLAAIFKAAGVASGDRVIAYCHIGQQATAVIFAARTLGIEAVLYDGSFEDWARRKLPVEKPAERLR